MTICKKQKVQLVAQSFFLPIKAGLNGTTLQDSIMTIGTANVEGIIAAYYPEISKKLFAKKDYKTRTSIPYLQNTLFWN